jgi:hypothetical protein
MTDAESMLWLNNVLQSLQAAGARPAHIVAALVETTIKAAEADPDHTATHLDSAAVILSTVARGIRGREVFPAIGEVFNGR